MKWKHRSQWSKLTMSKMSLLFGAPILDHTWWHTSLMALQPNTPQCRRPLAQFKVVVVVSRKSRTNRKHGSWKKELPPILTFSAFPPFFFFTQITTEGGTQHYGDADESGDANQLALHRGQTCWWWRLRLWRGWSCWSCSPHDDDDCDHAHHHDDCHEMMLTTLGSPPWVATCSKGAGAAAFGKKMLIRLPISLTICIFKRSAKGHRLLSISVSQIFRGKWKSLLSQWIQK